MTHHNQNSADSFYDRPNRPHYVSCSSVRPYVCAENKRR